MYVDSPMKFYNTVRIGTFTIWIEIFPTLFYNEFSFHVD